MATLGELKVHLTTDIRAFRADLGEATELTKQWSRGMERIGRRAQNIGRTLRNNVTAPMLLVGAASVKAASEFETSLVRMRTLAGSTEEEMRMMGDAALRMSGEVARGPRELADAMYYVASSGFTARESIQLVELAAKGAAIGLGDTIQVADLLTSTMNAYRGTNLTAAQAMDQLIVSIQEGKAETDEMADSMSRVLPIASEMGITFGDAAAAIAAMSRLGADAFQSMTQLRALLKNLSVATPATQQRLASMGIELRDIAETLNQPGGLLIVLTELAELTERAPNVIQELFPDMRASTGVMNLLGNQYEEYRKIVIEVMKAHGELADSFELVAETAEFKLRGELAELEASTSRFGAVLMGPVAGVLNDLNQLLTDVTFWFAGLDDAAQRSVLSFSAMVAISGPLAIAIGTLVSAFAALAAVVVPLAVSMTPLIAVGLALGGAAVVGGYIAAKNSIEDYIDSLGKRLPDAAREAEEAIVKLQQRMSGLSDADLDAQISGAEQTLRMLAETPGLGAAGGVAFVGVANELANLIEERSKRAQAMFLKDLPTLRGGRNEFGDSIALLNMQRAAEDAETLVRISERGQAAYDREAAAIKARNLALKEGFKEGSVDWNKFVNAQTSVFDLEREAAFNLDFGRRERTFAQGASVRETDIMFGSRAAARVSAMYEALNVSADRGDTAEQTSQLVELALAEHDLEVAQGDRLRTQDKLYASTLGAQEAVIGLKMEVLALENPMFLAAHGLEGLANGLTSMFESVFLGTKSAGAAFKEFARQMISDLLAIFFRLMAVKIVMAAIGFGADAGIPGFAMLQTAANQLFPVERASGGSLRAGQLALVGERGPELFMPNKAGTVIPNHSLGAPQLNLNIINQGPPLQASETRERGDVMEVVVTSIVNKGLNNGTFDSAMRRNFANVRTGQ